MTRAVFKAHLKLVLRSPWPWAITSVVALLGALLGRKSFDLSAAGYVVQQFVFPLYFLGQMLATVSLARQERLDRTGELFEAVPYSSAAWVAGRFAAFYVTWLAGATILWAIPFLVMSGPPVSFLGFPLALLLLVVPVTLLFTVGVPMALAHFVRRGFSAYAATLVIFLLCSFSGLQVLSGVNMALGSGPATNADFTLALYFPISTTGLFPNKELLIYNRLGAAAFGIGGAALLAWVVARRRREPNERRIRWIWVGALVAIAYAGLNARSIGLMRLETVAAEEIQYGRPRAALAPVPVPVVSAYEVRLSLDDARPSLSGEAKLELSAPGESAIFTLGQAFQVSGVTGPNGSPVPFTRQGDMLMLHTRGQAGSYTVSYGGRVQQWRRDNWNGLRLAAHISPRSVVLPVSLGWYPLPGLHSLAFKESFRVDDAGLSHAPVPLKLEVTGPQGLHFVSNVGDGAPVRAAWLIGTPWAPQERDGIRYYVSSDAAAATFGANKTKLEYLQALVPIGSPFVVVELPVSLWFVQGLVPPSGFPGAMVISDTEFGRQDGMVMQDFITNAWWSNGRTEEERQVYDVLQLFMLELYERDVRGRSKVTMSTMTGLGGPHGTTTPEGKALLEALHQFEQRRGLDPTRLLLRELHQSEESLTFSAVRQSIGRVVP